MIERPILFNGEMVRAILDGRKTQTRRIAKLNASGRVQLKGKNWHIYDQDAILACPLGQVGDRLWVRETFVQGFEADECGDISSCDENGNAKPIQTWYRADGHINWEDDGELCNTPWKPSIHMPRSASRITLEITDVRIERLQSISESDAIAEGCDNSKSNAAIAAGWYEKPKAAYRRLWNSIYKNWDENPWVWVIEFRRVEK